MTLKPKYAVRNIRTTLPEIPEKMEKFVGVDERAFSHIGGRGTSEVTHFPSS